MSDETKELTVIDVNQDEITERWPEADFTVLNRTFYFQPDNGRPYDCKVVAVRIDPDDKEDAYVDDGAYRLKKRALRSIMQAAGVKTLIGKGFTERIDDGSDPNRVHHRYAAEIRLPTGEWVQEKSEKEITREALEAEYRVQYWRKFRDKDWFKKKSPEERREYVQKAARERVDQEWPHAAAKCETMAMLRFARSHLGVKHAYSKAELQKPLIVFQVVPQPKNGDQKVFELLEQKQVELTTRKRELIDKVIDTTTQDELRNLETEVKVVAGQLKLLRDLTTQLEDLYKDDRTKKDEAEHNGRREALFGTEEFEGFDTPSVKVPKLKEKEPGPRVVKPPKKANGKDKSHWRDMPEDKAKWDKCLQEENLDESEAIAVLDGKTTYDITQIRQFKGDVAFAIKLIQEREEAKV